MIAEARDPIRPWKRIALFARIPLALGLALSLAQIFGPLAGRDAALLGAPAGASPAPWEIVGAIMVFASLLPGVIVLLRGVQRGILFSIVGLLLYLFITVVTVGPLGVVLPVLAPVGAWYLSQVMGIGWRPHAEQNVKHFLPAGQQRVFVSYRRSLDEITARLLKQELAARGFDVFLDVDDLGPSPRFDRRLLDEIGARYNFVLLLSPGSLARCQDEHDWVRLELEHALATERRVIPVTRAGFELGDDHALPPSIKSLPLHNAVVYSSPHHAAVIEQLVGFLCAPRTAPSGPQAG